MGSRRDDRRSPEAAAYRPWYWTPEWKRLRRAQLEKQPFCRRPCHGASLVVATVVNHRTPHKGDRTLFFDPDNLESVCSPCHDGPIQREERAGFSPAVDAGGWPTDPKHPANRSSR